MLLENLTKAHSLRNTSLTDRILWFDGDSTYDANRIARAMMLYDTVRYADEITEEIKQFNRSAPPGERISIKDECRPLSFDWKLPPEYANLDVVEYLLDKHVELTLGMDSELSNARDYRLITEIARYKQLELFDVLRAIIWIINTLSANNVVWGVGRGSSVSSYVLYVIGVHDVDSYAYGLDIDDFLHT